MKKSGKHRFSGIGRKMFNVFLATLICIFAAFGILNVLQVRSFTRNIEKTGGQQKNSITWLASNSIENLIEDDLSRTCKMGAFLADSIFKRLNNEITTLTSLFSFAYQYGLTNVAPDFYSDANLDVFDPSRDMEGELSLQILTAPYVDRNDPEVRKKVISLVNSLEESFTYSIANNPMVDSVFISTPDGITLIVDRHPASKIGNDGTIIQVDPTTRPWFLRAVEEKAKGYTEIEVDTFTGKLGLVCYSPAYDGQGNLLGVVGMDIFLDSLAEGMSVDPFDRRMEFIVNDHGHIIFSPEGDGILAQRYTDNAVDLRASGYGDLNFFMARAMRGVFVVNKVHIGDDAYCMASAPIPSMGWTLVSVIEQSVIAEPVNDLVTMTENVNDSAYFTLERDVRKTQIIVVVMLVLGFGIGSVVTLFVAKRITHPVELMTSRITDIDGDHFDFEMSPEFHTKDEIEVLAKAFAALSVRTKNYISTITQITTEKERIRAELNVAAQIQADMLPRVFPPYPVRNEFNLYGSMTPAKEVGGDFFDFFFVDDDTLALVIADVSGKGVPAALFMVIAKTLLKTRAMSGGSPSSILADVNSQLCDGNDTGLFVTVWLAMINLKTGKAVSSNAGHEHPAIRRNGDVYKLDSYRHSPPLALLDGVEFFSQEFEMHPGDALFVYTDGIPEATDSNNELFGSERMLEALNVNPEAEPEEVLSNVVKGVKAFVKDAEQFDDMTMLCFKYNGSQSAPEVRKLETDAVVENLDEVLGFVDEVLEANGCSPSVMMQLDVAVEEIYVNIAHYAYRPDIGKATITSSFDPVSRELTLVFEDSGKKFDPLAKEDPDISLPVEERQIGGLGIFMVKKSMDKVMYEYKDNKNILTIIKKI